MRVELLDGIFWMVIGLFLILGRNVLADAARRRRSLLPPRLQWAQPVIPPALSVILGVVAVGAGIWMIVDGMRE